MKNKAIITVELDLTGIIDNPHRKEERKWLLKDFLRVGKGYGREGVLLHSNLVGDAWAVKVLKCVIKKKGKSK